MMIAMNKENKLLSALGIQFQMEEKAMGGVFDQRPEHNAQAKQR